MTMKMNMNYYFMDIINNKIDKNIINFQDIFWGISEYVINDFKNNIN